MTAFLLSVLAGLISGLISGAIVGGIFYWLGGRDLRTQADVLRAEVRLSRRTTSALARYLGAQGIIHPVFDDHGNLIDIVPLSGAAAGGSSAARALTIESPSAGTAPSEPSPGVG